MIFSKHAFRYRVLYMIISGIGLLLATTVLTGQFNTGFFVYYTNLSNLVAFSMMGYVVFLNYQAIQGRAVKFHYTTLRFMVTIMILVTLIIYNTLLGNLFDPNYWRVRNVIMHLIAPLMFVLDYLLFSQPNTVQWQAILYSLLLPYTYVLVTLIIGHFTQSYPYFFLNVNTIGYKGVFMWVFMLTLGFIFLGVLLWVYNRKFRRY